MAKYSRKRLALAFGGVLVAALFLALALRNVDLGESWRILRGLDPRYFPVLAAISAISLLLRPWRWRDLFPRDHRPTFRKCFGALTIGLMLNNLLPGRAGDVARCFLARGKHGEGGVSLALATLGLEKLIDGLALLLVVTVSFLFFTPPMWLRQLGVASAAVFILAAVFFVGLKQQRAWVAGKVEGLFGGERWGPLGRRAASLFEGFAEGLAVLTSGRQLVKISAATLGIWVLEAYFVQVCCRALGIGLEWPQALAVAAILGLGLMIPLAPAAIGTYQFFTVSALGIFGVDGSRALALSVVMHAWIYVATSLPGLAALAAEGLGPLEVLRGRWRSSEGSEAVELSQSTSTAAGAPGDESPG